MKIQPYHQWNLSVKEAKEVQASLSRYVVTEDKYREVNLVCGVDVGFQGAVAVAALSIFSFPDLRLLEIVTAKSEVSFPYVPGLLSFREIPPLLQAFKGLKNEPDLIFTDGHGIAHPRKFGLACHLGLIFDKPTIGCAKSKLVGEYREPGRNRGDSTYLSLNRKIIGEVLRTRDNVKPVFVSVGHRISLKSALRFTLQCTHSYRLPEPIRFAHRATSDKYNSNDI
jgi:deoxyribonuclease V